MAGYIYIRENDLHNVLGIVKMGKTENLKRRDRYYITGEPEKGEMSDVYKIENSCLDLVEKVLQNKFKEFHYVGSGGVEFYKKEIKERIEPALKQLFVNYKKLCREEINELLREPEEEKEENKKREKTPRDYQQEIILKSIGFFKKTDKGFLNLCCGAGKTLISLFICKLMRCEKILIAVPSEQLQEQWRSEIKSLNYFQDFKICKFGERSVFDLSKIKKYIVIVIYKSSSTLLQKNLTFDFKILDEAHHLTKNDQNPESETFFKILNINSVKTLSLSATPKVFENGENIKKHGNNIYVSNLNFEYFGEHIHKLTLWEGIEKGIVCDFEIKTVIFKSVEEYMEIAENEIETDKNLFISAVATLKILKQSSSINRILFYVNKIENGEKVLKYIEKVKIYFDIKNLFYEDYNIKKSYPQRKQTLNKFTQCEKGILISAYCLGEGTDLPNLEAVVIGDPMGSETRIYQSCLRPCRKDPKNPEKIGSIIIPCLELNDQFDTVNAIVSTFSNEDPEIYGKIKVYSLEKERNINSNITESCFVCDEKLSEKMSIEVKKRQNCNISFTHLKKRVKEKELKTKEDYLIFAKKEGYPEDVETSYTNCFKGWVDFLGIKSEDYYDLKTCKEKIGEYINNKSVVLDKTDLNFTMKKLNTLDLKIPDPCLIKGLYDIDLSHVMNVRKKKS